MAPDAAEPTGRRSTAVLEVARRSAPLLVVLATIAYAVVVQSAFFARSSWMMGDLAYHRGVAYTMQGGDFQGEGPYAGLLTYYGGLYPLLIAWAGLVSGATFDHLVTLVSWVAPAAWPVALGVLGWRLFRGRPWAIAALVLIGTVAAPLTTSRDVLWVDSVLPSGSTFWPIFPRDVAIVLVTLMLVVLTSSRRVVRVLAAGGLIGLTILFHAQVGILSGWFAAVWSVWRAARTKDAVRLLEPVGMGLVAAAITAWWVLPRGLAVARSGSLLLADLPDRLPLRLDPLTFVVDFGVVGVLGVIGIVVAVRRRGGGLAGELGLVWVLALAPLVLIDRVVPTIEFFSERRIWLLISIGLVVLATVALTELASAFDRPVRFGGERRAGPLAAAAVAGLVVVTSLPATGATVTFARTQWRDGSVGGEMVDVGQWNAAMAALRQRVTTGTNPVVVTYDGMAAWTWSFSGASVADAWLPGFIKLGFDPARMTGFGQLDRAQLVATAFDQGLDGLCSLRSSLGATTLMLETRDGLVGSFGHSFGAAFRVPPQQRDLASTNRAVGNGLTYVDVGTYDGLKVASGESVSVPWSSRSIQRVELVVKAPASEAIGDLVTLQSGRQALPLISATRVGPAVRLAFRADGVRPRLQITAVRTVTLIRGIGYEAPATAPDVPNGYVVEQADAACAAPRP
jgi:hypothetical protein